MYIHIFYKIGRINKFDKKKFHYKPRKDKNPKNFESVRDIVFKEFKKSKNISSYPYSRESIQIKLKWLREKKLLEDQIRFIDEYENKLKDSYNQTDDINYCTDSDTLVLIPHINYLAKGSNKTLNGFERCIYLLNWNRASFATNWDKIHSKKKRVAVYAIDINEKIYENIMLNLIGPLSCIQTKKTTKLDFYEWLPFDRGDWNYNNNDELKSVYDKLLKQIYSNYKKYQNNGKSDRFKVCVFGFADQIGGEPVNNQISWKRANYIRKGLEEAISSKEIDWKKWLDTNIVYGWYGKSILSDFLFKSDENKFTKRMNSVSEDLKDRKSEFNRRVEIIFLNTSDEKNPWLEYYETAWKKNYAVDEKLISLLGNEGEEYCNHLKKRKEKIKEIYPILFPKPDYNSENDLCEDILNAH